MLLATHRGCTMPGCTANAYRSQVHHANADWQHGGQTNIEDLTLVCGPERGCPLSSSGGGVHSVTPSSGRHFPERILDPGDP
ncbi:hypothetical protein BVC93_26570 [Mycobacterium sp. MS1601]|nr:hypothetical protein BVC93_26570 [Mycobacterium sp. MS1601]